MTGSNKEINTTEENGTDYSLLAMGCVLLAVGVTLYSTISVQWISLLFMVAAAVLLVKYIVSAFKDSAEEQ